MDDRKKINVFLPNIQLLIPVSRGGRGKTCQKRKKKNVAIVAILWCSYAIGSFGPHIWVKFCAGRLEGFFQSSYLILVLVNQFFSTNSWLIRCSLMNDTLCIVRVVTFFFFYSFLVKIWAFGHYTSSKPIEKSNNWITVIWNIIWSTKLGK